MKKILLFFIACIGMIACSSDDNQQGQNVEFNTVFKSDFFNSEYDPNNDVTIEIFNDQESWNLFLMNFNDGVISEVIDFEQYTIIAVIDKNHPDGGYDFKVESLIEYENTIKIHVSSFASGIWQSPSRPIHIIKTPKTTKNLNLQINFINN